MNRIIKTYKKDFIGNSQRKKAEAKLFAEGYTIESEEDIKQWDAGQACCLGLLFLPLVLFAKVKKIRVTYIKE